MSRRTFGLGALGVLGAGSLLYFARDHDSNQDRAPVDHVVVVGSVRESRHDVTVETIFDGEAATYGPREVSYQDHWEVTRFTTPGELSVTFRVDGKIAWEDTHELPSVSGSRRSITLLELEPDGEVLTRVYVEE